MTPVFIALAVLVLVVLLSMRDQSTVSSSRLSKVIKHPDALESDKGLRIVWNDVPYDYLYIAGGEGPSFIHLSRPLQPSQASGAALELPTMVLRQENDRDRFGKSIGLNRELQTGDQLFDARIYVECDTSGSAAERMLRSPDVRKGVTGLLALGFKSICFRKHGHALVVIWQLGAQKVTNDILEEAMNRMTQIADNLPPFRRIPTDTQQSPGALLMQIHIATVFFFGLGALYVTNTWDALGSGLDKMIGRGSLGLFVAHLVVSWLWVRGSSNALRNLTLANLIALMAIPLTLTALLYGANGIGDTAVISYTRALEHKRISESDDSTNHYLYFATIPGMKGSSFSLSVSSQEYRQAEVGDLYELSVGRGNLGVPWLRQLTQQP